MIYHDLYLSIERIVLLRDIQGTVELFSQPGVPGVLQLWRVELLSANSDFLDKVTQYEWKPQNVFIELRCINCMKCWCGDFEKILQNTDPADAHDFDGW